MSAQRVLSVDELPEVGAVRVIVDGLPVAVYHVTVDGDAVLVDTHVPANAGE